MCKSRTSVGFKNIYIYIIFLLLAIVVSPRTRNIPPPRVFTPVEIGPRYLISLCIRVCVHIQDVYTTRSVGRRLRNGYRYLQVILYLQSRWFSPCRVRYSSRVGDDVKRQKEKPKRGRNKIQHRR